MNAIVYCTSYRRDERAHRVTQDCNTRWIHIRPLAQIGDSLHHIHDHQSAQVLRIAVDIHNPIMLARAGLMLVVALALTYRIVSNDDRTN